MAVPEFPRVQAVPYPDGVSFQRDGTELLAYQFGLTKQRPYLFPVRGPSGKLVTRLGHPHDPVGHRHHYSVWCAHLKVNGHDFWADMSGCGRQVHQCVLRLEDGVDRASIVAQIHWVTGANELLLDERRRIAVRVLDGGPEYLLDSDSELTAATQVELGKTNFAWLAVRVTKTMGVHDGGGTITNSEGAVDEKAIFWQRASWCDYSGRVAADEINGITLFPHPTNRNNPPQWHVRDDGWMAPCPFFEQGLTLAPGQELALRHRLLVHAGRVQRPRAEALLEEYAAQ
jgi:hypothetical protein